jgi:hypothetical protein
MILLYHAHILPIAIPTNYTYVNAEPIVNLGWHFYIFVHIGDNDEIFI